MRFWQRTLLTFIFRVTAIFYLSPSNTSYFWNFGFLAFIFLILQMITGIFLAMFYNPSALLAFEVIMYINNEVYYGWWLRLLHANGASWFFLVVYLHMLRSIYYGSFVFPRQYLWVSGIVIWFLMIVTAFLGYVLPWGQMSFWAAMVITNLLSSIPYIGVDLIYLLWGGFTISDASLHRFYSLHFTLPFVIFFLSIVHILFLHEFGSNNLLGIVIRTDGVPFAPYYVLKDLFSLVLVFIVFFFIVFLLPDLFGHSDNYIRANFLVTPTHIVPEWYFLPLYAVLRSITHKFLGFVLLLFFVFSLALLPYVSILYLVRSSSFKPSNALFFWFFLFDCLLLGWIGGLAVDAPYFGLVSF
jgi:quinol-cytochrome oxidoreductase complex cytochrome b subunit